MAKLPWYADGLRFECTRCGNCCTGEPGTVLVSDEELAVLGGHLDLSPEALRAIHTRTLPSGRVTLRERANYECTFWDTEAGCTVHAHRPRQCRTWPFWQRNLQTPRDWRDTATGCPGIGQGPLHDAATITATSKNDGTFSSAYRAEHDPEPPPRGKGTNP